MSSTETISRSNKQTFMDFYHVKQSNKSADLESLLGHLVSVIPPVFLDHRSLFERDGQPLYLTAELYAAHWPSAEGFKELTEWCRYYGLRYEEPKGIDSWHNPSRCRVLMFYKDNHH